MATAPPVEPSPVSVVYLGPKYTFSHEAAQQLFSDAQHFHANTPREVFKKVESGQMDYGILPVENSSTGVISDTYPLLLDQDLQPDDDAVAFAESVKVQIVREHYLRIRLHLLARSQIALSEIQILYTHRQPYLQSATWVGAHLPTVTIEYTDSTAAAAERLFEQPNSACIGSELLARGQNLVTIKSDIQDYARNVTRFFAIASRTDLRPHEQNKSTLALILPDRVGALVEVLQHVAKEGLSLRNIKTLPVRAFHIYNRGFRDWFVIDLAVGGSDSRFGRLLEVLRGNRDVPYKILGSYMGHDADTKLPKTPGAAEQPLKPTKLYEELIQKGESEATEFKATLRFDLATKSATREVSCAAVKTICAFGNSKGGNLFIGISDAGNALGLDADLRISKRKNLDGLMASLYELVANDIGKEFCQLIHTEFVTYQDKTVLWVRVDPSPKPMWFRDGAVDRFLVRVGNTTRELSGKETTEYLLSRMNGS